MKSQTSLQEKIGSLIRLCLIVSLLTIGIRPVSAQNNIVLQSETNGSVYQWTVDGLNITEGNFLFDGDIPEWKVVGTPDLDNNGYPGVLFQSRIDGSLYYWRLSGSEIVDSDYLSGSLDNWKVVSTPKLGGLPSILFQHSQTGAICYWQMKGFDVVKGGFLLNERITAWLVAGTADLNGDGQSDVVMQNKVSGGIYALMLNGTRIISRDFIYKGNLGPWKLVAIPEYNGYADLIFQNKNDGSVYRWEVDGFQITDSDYVFRGSIPEWKVVGTPDLFNAGQPGILLQSQVDGAVYFWDMDGFDIVSGDFLFDRSIPEWRVVGDYLK